MVRNGTWEEPPKIYSKRIYGKQDPRSEFFRNTNKVRVTLMGRTLVSSMKSVVFPGTGRNFETCIDRSRLVLMDKLLSHL